MKIFRVIVLLLVVMLLGACGGDTATTMETSDPGTTEVQAVTTTTARTTTTTAPTATTEAESTDDPMKQPWGGTADLGDLQICVSAPVDDTANLGESIRAMLGEGEKAVYCMVTITNSGDGIYAYNAYLSFTMYDLEGFSYDSLVPISTQPDLGSGEALPGKTVKGSISYALSAASEPDYVIFRRDIISETEAAWGAE